MDKYEVNNARKYGWGEYYKVKDVNKIIDEIAVLTAQIKPYDSISVELLREISRKLGEFR